MLRHSEAVAVVIAESFGGVDYLELYEGFLTSLPDLQYLVTVGEEDLWYDDRIYQFEDLVSSGEAGTQVVTPAIDPAKETFAILYTSGTMGKPKGKPWETRKVSTICGYCGCGCELQLDVVNDQVVGVSSSNGSVNNGELCVKGRFGYDFVNHKDRLRQPLIRRNGHWEEANWDEALDYVAERLADIRIKHGADAIGGLSSARCTNEDNYLFQ